MVVFGPLGLLHPIEHKSALAEFKVV